MIRMFVSYYFFRLLKDILCTRISGPVGPEIEILALSGLGGDSFQAFDQFKTQVCWFVQVYRVDNHNIFKKVD